MKRQLLFAAALAPDVPVRILDEISEGLDPTKRSEVLDRLEADAAEGRTILLSSHHLGEVDRVCGRLLFLAQGKLIADEDAGVFRQRTARLVRVTYADDAAAETAARVLGGLDLEEVRREGKRVAVVLREDDPRPFLAALASRDGLAAPLSIEHGRPSLADLYRDLYGVEGV